MPEIYSGRNVADAGVEKVFRLDGSIRYIVLLATDGTVEAISGRPGISSLEPEKETYAIFMRAAIAIQMSEPMNRYHGRLRTAIMVRDKITLISFVLSGRIVLVSADSAFELGKVEKLGQMIDGLKIDLS